MKPTDTETALDQLAAARSPIALREASGAVKKAIAAARRKARAALGPLAQTFIAAMQIWDSQKAQGVSREERIAGLAKTLKAAWPKGRESEWKYLCQDCDDYGLIPNYCPGGERNGATARCGRTKPHLAHDFGTPCWCPKGARFREAPRTPEDAIARAAKTKKPSGWSRMGR